MGFSCSGRPRSTDYHCSESIYSDDILMKCSQQGTNGRFLEPSLAPSPRLPDGLPDGDVQGPHLIDVGEAGQVGSQSLTEPLSFLPGTVPAQPLLVEHLTIRTSSDEETGRAGRSDPSVRSRAAAQEKRHRSSTEGSSEARVQMVGTG